VCVFVAFYASTKYVLRFCVRCMFLRSLKKLFGCLFNVISMYSVPGESVTKRQKSVLVVKESMLIISIHRRADLEQPRLHFSVFPPSLS